MFAAPEFFDIMGHASEEFIQWWIDVAPIVPWGPDQSRADIQREFLMYCGA